VDFSRHVEPEDPGIPVTLMVVDVDLDVLSAVKRVFRNEPYDVLLTDDPFEALARVKSRPIEVVIADEFMPGMSGTDLLQEAGRHSPGSALIVLTGYPRSRGGVLEERPGKSPS
jgi:DNA-binding NtrC family response regulator